MKKLFIIVFFFILVSGLFSQSGGGIGIFVPLSGAFSMSDIKFNDNVPNADRKFLGLKSDAAFEWGVLLQPGYFYGFGNRAGVSVLFDLGYYRDVFAYIITNKNNGASYKESYAFDSINLGLIPKFHFLFLSIGVGGGIKVPLAMEYYTKQINGDGSYSQKYNSSELKSVFSGGIIPYIKVTLDFMFNFNRFSAIAFGIYLNYDFPMHKKLNEFTSLIYSKYDISAIDFGFQIGLYLVGSKE